MKTILEHERRTTKKLEWKKKTNKTYQIKIVTLHPNKVSVACIVKEKGNKNSSI